MGMPDKRVRKLLIIALASWCCGPRQAGLAQVKGQAERIAPARVGAVEIQMRNVNFYVATNIILEIADLRGRLERTSPGKPVTFDDPDSFTVEIDSAHVAMTPDSLAALMNSYVMGYEGAPIKNVTFKIDGDRLVQKGTIHKGVGLPFEIQGSLSATEDGNIRMHADKIKAEHLPVKGLLHLFGEDLAKLMKKSEGRGMRVEGDDVILMPASLTPPPHMFGRVTQVGIQNGKIVQVFDSGRRPPALKPPFRSAAYIYHRGGVLRFGKLTMTDADLEIVGDRPGVFNFFQRDYEQQLVAGYSKNTRAKGLVAHMVDYSRFRGRTAQPQSSGAQ